MCDLIYQEVSAEMENIYISPHRALYTCGLFFVEFNIVKFGKPHKGSLSLSVLYYIVDTWAAAALH